jgi:hypothetical protein
MKLTPAGVGAEPKKIALLGGLVVLLVVVLWMENRSDSPAVSANVTPPVTAANPAPVAPVQPAPAPSAPSAAAAALDGTSEPATQRRAPLGASSGGDNFVPSLKKSDDVDLSKVDPRIHLELLAKVRGVPLEGGSSSLFDFSKPPEAALPKVEPIKPAAVPVPPPAPKPVAVAAKSTQPPPPPPIPFKYYGYEKATDGQIQQGLFLAGDPNTGNIYSKREGDVIKDRYKIVHIGLRSVTVEDTVTHNQQQLKILDEQP